MTGTILERIDNLLKKANFETFLLDHFTDKKNKFCFDLLVKKNDNIFSVKIFSNIDNLSPDTIEDIKSLSLLLKSKPLLIGIRNRYQELEDNTIYIREGLPFITLATLENLVNKELYPYILARRGGGVMFLNGNIMKLLREKRSISRKELSELLGVTKRTVCAYENESMRPSETIANKISEILDNQDIFRKINLFEWNFKFEIDKKETREEVNKNPFESHLQEVLDDIGISSYWYRNSPIPFKLSLYSKMPNEKEEHNFYPLFSGVSEEDKKINELSFKCLKMFTEVFHANSLFIINNNIKIPDSLKKIKIPIVKIRNLEKVDDEAEFIDLIQESGN
ncbi:MAG: helix-turn-helix domain-containing protein [Candidatus Lokiarchaeota archaeon]|nr:helix-turn-helix domain-containing protein [Candidatus Lokiarchaeota archaeon]